jgi:hypothetical protein
MALLSNACQNEPWLRSINQWALSSETQAQVLILKEIIKSWFI